MYGMSSLGGKNSEMFDPMSMKEEMTESSQIGVLQAKNLKKGSRRRLEKLKGKESRLTGLLHSVADSMTEAGTSNGFSQPALISSKKKKV